MNIGKNDCWKLWENLVPQLGAGKNDLLTKYKGCNKNNQASYIFLCRTASDEDNDLKILLNLCYVVVRLCIKFHDIWSIWTGVMEFSASATAFLLHASKSQWTVQWKSCFHRKIVNFWDIHLRFWYRVDNSIKIWYAIFPEL